MNFDMQNNPPIFLKFSLTKAKKRKLDKLANEFAGTLNNEQGALLLDWLSVQINKRMVEMKIDN